MHQSISGNKILSIDIGGSYIKAALLDTTGELQTVFQSVDTPVLPGPKTLIAALKDLADKFPVYDKLSVGFPGYVKDGIVFSAPSLAPTKWHSVELQNLLCLEFECPVKVINDADMQGLGIASGKGFELVITLGTGLGSALLLNGVLLPHLELSQHPIVTNVVYDKYIGKKALEDEGEEKWNERIRKMIAVFRSVFNYDRLFIGGGNSGKINIKLDKNITIVSNEDGIRGGAKLW